MAPRFKHKMRLQPDCVRGQNTEQLPQSKFCQATFPALQTTVPLHGATAFNTNVLWANRGGLALASAETSSATHFTLRADQTERDSHLSALKHL